VWIAENVRKKLSVQMLADRVAMSVRNCDRVFTRELLHVQSGQLERPRSLPWRPAPPQSSDQAFFDFVGAVNIREAGLDPARRLRVR
jgi:hypothetical protein